ncbi:MAG: hypothetical protein WA144_15470 [Candidatus Methanoperedens sp.]
MTEYPKEYFNIYYQALAIMEERQDNGIANNEGLLFFKTEE